MAGHSESSEIQVEFPLFPLGSMFLGHSLASAENVHVLLLAGLPYELDAADKVHLLECAGLGIEVDEGIIAAHSLIDGPCFV